MSLSLFRLLPPPNYSTILIMRLIKLTVAVRNPVLYILNLKKTIFNEFIVLF